MSSITPSTLQGIGTVGINAYHQAASNLAGNPQLIHFLDVRTGACIFQFDAVINEQHAMSATVTSFPVEGGQAISDHVMAQPPVVTIQGIISDTPVGSAKALLQEAIATGISVIPSSLFLATAGTLYGATTTYQADQGQASPSQAAFAKLMLLANGDPEATPPVPPCLVHVSSRLNLYTNMAIRSVSVPRDKTISSAIVVQIELCKLRIVAPQIIDTAILQDPSTASPLIDEGQKSMQESEFTKDLKKLNKAGAMFGIAPIPVGN